MHIAIDASCWWNRRGFGRFARGLLPAILRNGRGHRYTLLVDRPAEDSMLATLPGAEFVALNPRTPVTRAATADSSRTLMDLLAARRAVARLAPDLVYFPAVYSWFPLPFGTSSVVTLHDAIAEHFPSLVFPGWRGRMLWSAKMHLARWQARRIISVSQAARDEIVTYIGADPDLIDVVTEAADEHFRPIASSRRRDEARSRAGLPGGVRLLMYVGGMAPHKNLPGLLHAFSRALQDPACTDLHLALVGDPGGDGFHSHTGELAAQVQGDTRLAARVHFTGFVDDEDLAALYSDALAVVLPSFSEGFGLPAIEAMACGTPVLVSTTGSLPEVAGDAALYFDPRDDSSIAAAIRRIAADAALLEQLRSNAAARARTHSWEAAAVMVLDSLERAVRGR